MSFAKSRNDFSKKDMNFFSEFSSGAAQQMSSAFPIFLLTAVAILAITFVFFIVCRLQIKSKQDKIDDIRAEMASAEYQARLAAKDQSQAEVEKLQQYYYVLTTLDSKVGGKSVSSVETLTTVVSCLPDDAILTHYDDVNGIVDIQGTTMYRESAMNFGKLLSDKDMFSFVEQEVAVFDPIEIGYDKDTLMYGECEYSFHFKCTLKGHFTLSWASFIDGTVPTPLTSLRSQSFNSGSDYKLPDIAKITENGVEYKLTNIKINGTAIDKAKLDEAIATGELTGKISSNMNIELMYTAAGASQSSEGGES